MDRESVTSDHSTAPTRSQETTLQGNLYTPASSVLELRHVSCAYDGRTPRSPGNFVRGTGRGNSLPTRSLRMREDDDSAGDRRI